MEKGEIKNGMEVSDMKNINLANKNKKNEQLHVKQHYDLMISKLVSQIIYK